MRDPQALADVRARLGLSQEAMAHLLGVSFVSVSRWERAKSSPLPAIVDLYEALAAALAAGCEPTEIATASRGRRPEFLRFLFNAPFEAQQSSSR